MAHVTREKRIKATKEDVKHLLEKLQDSDPDETLLKKITRETKKGIKNLLRCKKEVLAELSLIKYDGTFHEVLRFELGNMNMLLSY